MLEELKNYIRNVLGIDVEIKALNNDSLKKLPVYFKSEYTIYQLSLFQKDVLLAEVKGDFTTESLRKHLDIIGEKFHTTAIALINQLEAYKRLRLIDKKIPFIVPGKQMYMPGLLIDLKEFNMAPKEQRKAMTPATQMLVLYHLLIESLEGINLKNIADKLHYDSATITRSAWYLHNMNLCKLRGTKEKALHFELRGKELWEKTEPLMSNPVKKFQYYSGWIHDQNMFKANNNALAYYSGLNDDIVEFYAVRPGYFRFIGSVNIRKTARLEGNICIEEWKYNPCLLSKGGYVDPLSLYLCFRHETDERVKIALEQIIENIKW
jgi:hypothetical protein